MVVDAETLEKLLRDYILNVKKIIPIDKAFLFGSYAAGSPHEWSDVDVCFFSDCFEGKNSIDTGVKLLEAAHEYLPDVVFEPHALPTAELTNDNPFVKEVLRTGREIKIT
jgi:predicted nucleotidyltransferase